MSDAGAWGMRVVPLRERSTNKPPLRVLSLSNAQAVIHALDTHATEVCEGPTTSTPRDVVGDRNHRLSWSMAPAKKGNSCKNRPSDQPLPSLTLFPCLGSGTRRLRQNTIFQKCCSQYSSGPLATEPHLWYKNLLYGNPLGQIGFSSYPLAFFEVFFFFFFLKWLNLRN